MKINRDRYALKVDAISAEGPSVMLAEIETWGISHKLGVSNGEVALGARMSIVATIVFPDKFRGHKLLAEVRGIPKLRLWDDIDSDHLCLGRIDWYGEDPSTLHMAADVTLEAFYNFSRLLLDTDSEHRPELHVTAIGLESIEFAERELQKGVAAIDVSIAVAPRRGRDEHAE